MDDNRRPLIGITSGFIETFHGVGGRAPSYWVLVHTVKAIAEAGAIPLVIPPLGCSDAQEIVQRLAGLVLGGGGDVCPKTYGEGNASAQHEELDESRDAFELALIEQALSLGRPILGICRGIQVLNVALGGTLCQVAESIHVQNRPGTELSHNISIYPGTYLATAWSGRTEGQVNSIHHQGIDTLGSDLRISASAPDGIIEAVEADGASWVLGVQWHADLLWKREEEFALFQELVRRAKEAQWLMPSS